MIQNIIVYTIIAAAVISAVIYLVKKITNKDKGCNCGCGSANCKNCPAYKE